MSSEILIRRTSIADLQQVSEIERECRLSHWRIEDYAKHLSDTEYLNLIAETENKIIGFLIARLIISNYEAEIYNVGVTNQKRRRGVGLALLKRLINACQAKSIESVLLEVRASNSGAISFYKKLGFKSNGFRKNFYSSPVEDAALMKLNLKSA